MHVGIGLEKKGKERKGKGNRVEVAGLLIIEY